MAGIVFATSFDHFTTITQRFQSTSVGGSGTSLAIGAFGRRSSNGLRAILGGNGTPFAEASKTLPTNLTTLHCGFAYRTSGLPTPMIGGRIIWAARDVTVTQCDLRLLPTGRLRATRNGTLLGDSAAILSANTFYHIGIKLTIDNSAGIFELRVNEVPDANITLSGIDTQNTSNAFVGEIVIGARATTSADVGTLTNDFDDLVVRDDDYVGDREVGCYFVNGAGANTDWTPNTGTNHAAIDEAAPDGDTTYNASTTVGDKDTFPHQACSANAEIDAIIPLIYAQKTDAGTAQVAPVIRHSGTDYTGTDAAPSASSYEYHAPDVYMENPGTSSPWTPTDFNAAEFGYERTA